MRFWDKARSRYGCHSCLSIDCRDLPHQWRPVLNIFQSCWVPFMAQLNPTDTLFLIKISLSVSHLVPKIIGHKVSLIFHQILSFCNFESFCTKLLLDFRSCWLPFFSFLDLFNPSYWQNLTSDWVNFFSSLARHS